MKWRQREQRRVTGNVRGRPRRAAVDRLSRHLRAQTDAFAAGLSADLTLAADRAEAGELEQVADALQRQQEALAALAAALESLLADAVAERSEIAGS